MRAVVADKYGFISSSAMLNSGGINKISLALEIQQHKALQCLGINEIPEGRRIQRGHLILLPAISAIPDSLADFRYVRNPLHHRRTAEAVHHLAGNMIHLPHFHPSS